MATSVAERPRAQTSCRCTPAFRRRCPIATMDTPPSPQTSADRPMTKIKFGTDGWRAAIAEDYTFHNVRRCARGVAEHLQQTGAADRGVVVCHDRRFASEHFAREIGRASCRERVYGAVVE